jgi:hypothetical protein
LSDEEAYSKVAALAAAIMLMAVGPAYAFGGSNSVGNSGQCLRLGRLSSAGMLTPRAAPIIWATALLVPASLARAAPKSEGGARVESRPQCVDAARLHLDWQPPG